MLLPHLTHGSAVTPAAVIINRAFNLFRVQSPTAVDLVPYGFRIGSVRPAHIQIPEQVVGIARTIIVRHVRQHGVIMRPLADKTNSGFLCPPADRQPEHGAVVRQLHALQRDLDKTVLPLIGAPCRFLRLRVIRPGPLPRDKM